MKDKILRAIATFIIASGTGVGVYNYTGDTIIMPDGSELKSHDLKRSLTKFYKKRTIDKPLEVRIHHTAGSDEQSLESIAKFHVEQRGWAEIAYHIAIDKYGNVNLLNNIDEITYHDSGTNSKAIGIVLIGNYEVNKPTKEMINSVKMVVDVLCQELNIVKVNGHRDTSPTLCPGKYAYNELKETLFFE